MAFAPQAELPAYIRSAEHRFALSKTAAGQHDFNGSHFDVLSADIHEVAFGRTKYPLRGDALRGFFVPSIESNKGEYRVEEFGFVKGYGNSLSEAQESWCEELHVLIQSLLAKRPFEMTSEESQYWKVITSHIDITRYLQSLPLKVRRLGKVISMRSGRYAIQWDTGEYQPVRLEQMPPHFASFKVGQPVEAIATYSSDGTNLLSIDYIVKRIVLPTLPREKQEALWNALPTTHELPTAEW